MIVGGRWVPADGSNSRKPAPLLEEHGLVQVIKLGATPRLQLI